MRRALVAAVLAAIVIFAAIPMGGSASKAPWERAATPDKRIHTFPASPSRDRALREFWTLERMERAQPLAPIARPQGSAREAETPSHDPFVVPAQPPTTGPAERSHVPFDEYAITNPGTFPFSTNGKLFGRDRRGGGLFECSATVVSTENASVIFTAAHCIEGGERRFNWFKDITFVPAYSYGNAPYGTFVARKTAITKGWTRYGLRSNDDIGAAVLGTNAAGQRVADIAGARGFAAYAPRQQFFRAFGYPAVEPFDGQQLYACDSPYGGDEHSSQYFGPDPISIGCQLPPGSSGGGWIINDSELNSVTSFGIDDPFDTYGPYFAKGAVGLYNKVRNR